MSGISTYEIFIALFTICSNLQFVTMEQTILNRGFRLNNSTTLKSSQFKTFKVSANLAHLLGLISHKKFENCDSFLQCAFLCQSEEKCDFFNYDKSGKECISLDTSLYDVRDDGIYTCPSPFRIDGNDKFKFCQKVSPNSVTRIQAPTECSSIRGKLVVLIEDIEHNAAAFSAQKIHIATSKAVWIDATMDAVEKKWYWSDGTLVPESRFNQGSSFFQTRPTNKGCVAFLGSQYYLKSCTTETAYALCEADLVKL